MTSQLNLEDIYSELNNLLKDVCSFLTNETQNGTLSAKAKNEAEKLVSRSRQQVDIVTNLAALQESTQSNYPYLQMQGPPGAAVVEETLSEYVPAEITDYYEPEHYEESYPPTDNEPISISSPTPTINVDYCVYEELPFTMIEQKSVKYGPLCRKERYLFIEQKKQYMAGLVGYWLLIYALNKRDQKPLQVINLMNYSAKTMEERKDPTFVISADNDEKPYEFIARSIKDMEQWVVAINCKKHLSTNGRNLPEIPASTSGQDLTNGTNGTIKMNDTLTDVMHYGSEEDIYASVEDFGKHEMTKTVSEPSVEDFPKLPPRSIKEFPILPKRTITDNTYNNIGRTETEINNIINDDNEEEFEEYNELKVTETINQYVKKPKNGPQDNYDSVNPCEEEDLEYYDIVKPPNTYLEFEEEEEDMPDYDELKPINLPDKFKQTTKDEDLEDYDELKPIKPPELVKPEINSNEDEILEDYDVLKPFKQNNTPEEEEEELPDYDVLKPMPQKKTPTKNKNDPPLKNTENNNETKPSKPVKPTKKFWEKRLTTESSKKEIDAVDPEAKLRIENLKSQLNAQLLLSQNKSKPVITSPKPKAQVLLNKFPSFSKNRASKDDDGQNSKVQNIRQQLETTMLKHK